MLKIPSILFKAKYLVIKFLLWRGLRNNWSWSCCRGEDEFQWWDIWKTSHHARLLDSQPGEYLCFNPQNHHHHASLPCVDLYHLKGVPACHLDFYQTFLGQPVEIHIIKTHFVISYQIFPTHRSQEQTVFHSTHLFRSRVRELHGCTRFVLMHSHKNQFVWIPSTTSIFLQITVYWPIQPSYQSTPQ